MGLHSLVWEVVVGNLAPMDSYLEVVADNHLAGDNHLVEGNHLVGDNHPVVDSRPMEVDNPVPHMDLYFVFVDTHLIFFLWRLNELGWGFSSCLQKNLTKKYLKTMMIIKKSKQFNRTVHTNKFYLNLFVWKLSLLEIIYK